MSEIRTVRPSGRPDVGPQVEVCRGPHLLSALSTGTSLAGHRRLVGDLATLTLARLLELVGAADVRGRGGAGFPFERKLRTVASSGHRHEVVVNLGEGEPASQKDAALALCRPHLVLDGAELCARALGTRRVHLVLPGARPGVGDAVRRAVAERTTHRRSLRWTFHTAEDRFVAGQSRAVLELMAGRPGLPVTAWQPEAVDGHRGRSTLLSNAETFAHVALLAGPDATAYAGAGTVEEPGTRLLTIDGESHHPRVVEVPHGTPWRALLGDDVLHRPILLGGYHGTWVAPGVLADGVVSRAAMAAHGLALGAGAVLPLGRGDCPVHRTAAITGYLAGQSAGRCGPCRNGLPALADAVRATAHGAATEHRTSELARLVTGRGACAHPDGTARLVTSMLAAFGDEVTAHARGTCSYRAAPIALAGRAS